LAYLCGVSVRSLAQNQRVSVGTAYNRLAYWRDHLPHCADITRKYCSRFCGILLVDGKYIKVKGYERKIPVLYGIDYLTHDIPTYTFSLAENYQTCLSFFQSLKLLLYPLQAVVCDDNINIYQAAEHCYPDVSIQLCQNHYKESIREQLSVRTDPTYLSFMKEIEILFEKRRSKEEFQLLAGKLVYRYGQDIRCMNVLLDIQRRLPFLTGYMAQKRIPRTTNLIESYNSHLEGRLKSIKGFESFATADLWLNAYFLKRRLTKFTDCEGRFRFLNGTCSLEQTMKNPDKLFEVLRLIR
jgi:transposase-like protein